MRLIQSLTFVKDARLRQDGLFRWRIELDKEERHLYQCEDCDNLVTVYNSHPVGECSCKKCRVCGKPQSDRKHTSPDVPATGYYNPLQNALNQQQWGYQYRVVNVQAPPVDKKKPGHYYAPERRRRKH